jgi:hypothetical protein
MNLITQAERWHSYWQTVLDAADAERQLSRLRWLNDFAFCCGSAVHAEEFRALQQQIEAGEKTIAELNGDFESPSEAVSTFEQTLEVY